MNRSIAIVVVVLAATLGACSPATANSPKEGLFPMWADSQCWSSSAWKDCKEQRKALGVPASHFVLARREAPRGQ